MLLEEFDVKKYERSLREEGRIEGREEGEAQLAELLNHLLTDARLEDVRLAVNNKEVREKLYREYGIQSRI